MLPKDKILVPENDQLPAQQMRSKTQTDQFDLEYFFNLSPDLLCIAGFDGYFKKINPAVSKTLGYSLEELLNNPIDTFVHPEDRELTSRRRQELREGKVLFQFENRYVAKDGSVVWLFWTSVPIEKDQVIFAIAKDITRRKTHKGRGDVSAILEKLDDEQMRRFSADFDIIRPALETDRSNLKWMGNNSPVSQKDQVWLNRFESVVRDHAGRLEISLGAISADMAISERQLFRQVKRIMGITPNRLVRIVRMHLAWEAIASRKYHTVDEIAAIAGYSSKTHFKKLFSQVYGIDIYELL
jgi:PAS domain S-box-containing protein